MSFWDRLNLKGKKAVVTGGSRGLGFAMAQALGQAGAELVIASRDEEKLGEAASRLRDEEIACHTLAADLSTPQGAEAMCQQVLQQHGVPDILINNVGGRRIDIPTEEMPLEEWLRIIDLNLNQAFVCTKLLGGAMLPRRWGRIINVASICAMIAVPHIKGRSYETAKAALVMFTKATAADWAPYGVTVNAIAPGTFLTDTNRRWFEQRPQLQQDIEREIPMGRLGTPEEIGPLAVLLASDAASYITGSVFVIDGGRTLA